MSVFKHYARYYDLIYRDKDYRGEADYIRSLIEKFAPESKTILDLGCGTAGHAEHLARAGFDIHGIDLSDDMLKMAESRHVKLAPALSSRLKLSQGDVRSVRLGRKFDVVISLFHVMSYQPTNKDLLAAFKTAGIHLKAGGIFIFDCWYGPAVLTDRPVVRVKRLEDKVIEVTRIAEPTMYANDNRVDVNYQVIIREKSTEKVKVVNECHRMRYLFEPEIRELFASVGMKIVVSCGWMTSKKAGFNTWNACFVGQKQT